MAISEKGVKKAKELSGMKSGILGDDANKIAKFFSQDMTDEEIKQKAKEIFGAAAENMSIDMLKKNIKNNPKKKGEGLKEGRSTRKVTKVRGTGAATKGFRKARMS